jgi:hypothetical protein
MARLLAILLKTTDGPALKRSTITTMLNNAVANFNRWRNHTGTSAQDMASTR